jgi:hypothetical protein
MIALVLALTVSGVDIVEHKLLKDINWATQQELPNAVIKSYTTMSKRALLIIQNELDSVERKFNSYYDIDCHPGPLEIRIIKLSWLNSSEYFVWADPKYLVFGRYFGMRNVIYITPETFLDTYTLTHELTHYLYDECNIRFKSEAQEHQKLDDFIKWKSEINDP